jgi:hypothetical protein
MPLPVETGQLRKKLGELAKGAGSESHQRTFLLQPDRFNVRRKDHRACGGDCRCRLKPGSYEKSWEAR